MLPSRTKRITLTFGTTSRGNMPPNDSPVARPVASFITAGPGYQTRGIVVVIMFNAAVALDNNYFLEFCTMKKRIPCAGCRCNTQVKHPILDVHCCRHCQRKHSSYAMILGV